MSRFRVLVPAAALVVGVLLLTGLIRPPTVLTGCVVTAFLVLMGIADLLEARAARQADDEDGAS